MNDSDKDLHDEQLSNLYQQSRIEEPPMALDSVILTQARKAVEKPEKKRIWNRIGWVIPLASVAVAMLTVSLFIQTKQEHPEIFDSEIMYDVAPMEEGIISEEKEATEPLMDRKMRVAPAPKPAKEVMEKKAVSPPAIRLRSASPAPSSTTGAAYQTPKSKRKLEKQSRPAAASTFMAAPEPAQSDSLESGLINKEMESRDAIRSQSIRSQSEAESRVSVEVQIKTWLKQIRELIQQGKTDDARKSMEEFRSAHPDHLLPEDITSALR
jgi:type IV secretory pathway VirB10-like protein